MLQTHIQFIPQDTRISHLILSKIDTVLGTFYLAETEYGITDLQPKLESILSRYPQAHPVESATNHSKALAAHFEDPIHVHISIDIALSGTAFQKEVWMELSKLPFGKTATYGQLAQAIQAPTSQRAVGNAVGHNPLLYIIPCHRILPKQGGIGLYRWGNRLKQQLLDWEKHHLNQPVNEVGR